MNHFVYEGLGCKTNPYFIIKRWIFFNRSSMSVYLFFSSIPSQLQMFMIVLSPYLYSGSVYMNLYYASTTRHHDSFISVPLQWQCLHEPILCVNYTSSRIKQFPKNARKGYISCMMSTIHLTLFKVLFTFKFSRMYYTQQFFQVKTAKLSK